MQSIFHFDGIRKVALEIAYDNGMINRNSSEEDFLSAVDEIIGADGVDYSDLKKIDDWILSLSDEEISTLACGEHDEQVAVESQFSDPDLLKIFNDIFEIFNDIFEI